MMKKVVVIVGVILVTCVMFLYSTAYNKKSDFNLRNPDALAVYVYDQDKGDYVEQKDIPEGEILDSTKSYCVSGGEILNYSSFNGYVDYSLGNADKCYLYFGMASTSTYNYIEFTGQSYISTGYAAPEGFIAEVTFMPRVLQSSYILGSHELTDPYGRNGLGFSGAALELGTGDTFPQSITLEANKIYKAKFSTVKGDNYLYINDQLLIQSTDSSSRSDDPLIIGYNQYGLEFGGYMFNGRIYGIKIYTPDGKLVRDLVPSSGGTFASYNGFYDRVYSKYYYDTNFFAIIYDQGDLPDGYTELEYIETTGSQYIDTEYIANYHTIIAYDFEYISGTAGSWMPILGQRKTGGQNLFAIWVHADSKAVAINFDTVDTEAISGSNGLGRHLYTNYGDQYSIDDSWFTNNYTAHSFQIDGTTITTTINSGSQFTSEQSLHIFGMNNESSVNEQRNLKGRVYSLKIYEHSDSWLWASTSIVKSFVPCKSPDGEIGMYEKIEGKFYPNLGTGTFVAGPEIRNVPDGYIALPYIESTGTQYINPGVTVTPTTTIETDLMFTNSGHSHNMMFGSWAGSSGLSFSITESNNVCASLGSGQTQNLTNGTLSLNTKYKVTVNPDTGISINGTNYAIGNAPSADGSPIFIFAASDASNRNSPYAWGAYGEGRIYSFKIWQQDSLVRDFIPCISPDGKVGLYDNVEGKFYANEGTSYFKY